MSTLIITQKNQNDNKIKTLTKFETFEEVLEFFRWVASPININMIGGTNTPDTAIAKQTRFLELIGSPHLRLKMIHIAGTSGKGSTSTIMANALVSQGFKVGSSISPHIVDITERVQINGNPISKEQFVCYMNRIVPAINQMNLENQHPSYFEINSAIQVLAFADMGVDYAVIEVGMGGRLDATNIFVTDKLCILNSIGLDHTNILGKTLPLIAVEKAGIIQKNNLVVALSQTLEVNQVFIQKADLENADIDFVVPNFDFYGVSQYEGKTYFDYLDFETSEQQLSVGMLGEYQASNCALALRGLETLSDRDGWEISWDKLKSKLTKTTLIGRFDIKNINDKIVVIDGAHNSQKMSSFVYSLAKYYPNTQFDFLVAFKNGKDYAEMLNEILKHRNSINQIVITEFSTHQDSKIKSLESLKITEYLDSQNFANYTVLENTDLVDFISNTKNNLVITGSLYFLGNVYKSIK